MGGRLTDCEEDAEAKATPDAPWIGVLPVELLDVVGVAGSGHRNRTGSADGQREECRPFDKLGHAFRYTTF